MLENLNTIGWQSMTTASGTANAVPNLLRSLISPVPEVYEQAMEELSGTIWYQGTLYETTAFVVPFLVELLTSDVVQCKKHLLLELTELAVRCSPHAPVVSEDDQDENPWSEGDRPSWFSQEHLQQHLWMHQVYDAITRGLDVYLTLLNSHDPEIRMSVPLLLNVLEEYAETIIPFVRSCLFKERDPRVKASLLLSLGPPMNALPEYEQVVRTCVNSKREHPLVRVAAAFSQVTHMKEQTPAATREVLLEGLLPSQDMEEMYATLPWSYKSRRSLMGAISASLLALGLENTDVFIPRLLEALRRLDQDSQRSEAARDLALYDVIEAVLYFAFRGKGLPIQAIPFLLTKTQRMVLVALVKSPLVLHWNGDIAERMDKLGFPYLWKLRLLLLNEAL